MRRAFIAVTALTAAVLPLTAALAATATAPVLPKASLAQGAYPPPSAAERQDVRREFVEDAMRTVSDRSGDLFYLPRKYNFVTGVGPDKLNTGHVKVNGKIQTITSTGIAHGIPWSYDRDLPLVLWGPGFIKAGQVVKRRTAQQDWAPTIAQLIGCPRPTDASGAVLKEALLPTKRKPKVILTMLFDQGGEMYYRLHPGKTPFVDRLKREGTYYANTRVSHIDMETAMGHVAIGTGAFPKDHGLPSNQFWHGGAGDDFYCMEGPDYSQPTHMMSPTVGDWWLKTTQNKALLFSYCWADRAAIGMGGHGSFFQGNKKPWIYYFDQKAGKLATNPHYYEIPSYVQNLTPAEEVAKLTKNTGVWMEHPLKTGRDIVVSPAMAAFDGAMVRQVIAKEAWGQDDVPDLMYVTLKSTDLSGHLFGQESEESGAVLAEQDRQFEAIVKALVDKVGKENVVVALSADHGGAPLPELSGGTRLWEQDFLKNLNARFDKTQDGFPVAQYVSGTQLWIDERQLKTSGATMADVKRYVQSYRYGGAPFFEMVLTREEVDAMRRTGVYGF